MNRFKRTLLAAGLAMATMTALAQSDHDDTEALQIAAIEALIAAPPERALPLARKVVEGDYSAELKARALFVLSQIDDPEARQLILNAAEQGSGEYRAEAVRMIGISGDPEALTNLRRLWDENDEDLREAVLEAYLIADDAESVFELAMATQNSEAFGEAVETLGAMGAHEQLRRLREHALMAGGDASEALIEAYAIAGDVESLRELALDGSDPERQMYAIEGLAIAGGPEVDALLVDIYHSAGHDDIREAALEGMLITDNDEAVLELYRASDDPREKEKLLEMLVIMDSEAVWDVIDQALDGSAR